MNKSGYHTIFFDVGGTLIQSHPNLGCTCALVAEKYGIWVDQIATHRNLRLMYEQKRRSAEGLCGDGHSLSILRSEQWWRDIIGSYGVIESSESLNHMLIDEIVREYFKPQSYRVIDGVREVLECLVNKGYRLGVISNWDVRLRGILEYLNLVSYFDAFAISGEVGVEKPSPEIYKYAIRSIVNGEESETPDGYLMIGNDVKEDCDGATFVGMDARLIDRRNGSHMSAVLQDLLSA